MLRCAPTAGAHPVLMSTLAGTSASPDQRAALLWAAVVGWIAALALAAFAALWWAVASMLVVVAESLHPEVDPSPDPSGLVVGTAVAMLLCVAVALGASWVTARAPGVALPPALVGVCSGVVGGLVGLGVLCLVLGIDPADLLP